MNVIAEGGRKRGGVSGAVDWEAIMDPELYVAVLMTDPASNVSDVESMSRMVPNRSHRSTRKKIFLNNDCLRSNQPCFGNSIIKDRTMDDKAARTVATAAPVNKPLLFQCLNIPCTSYL